jgi:hypothetical protein
MGRTIKQLRAGELLFTDENILEVIRIYLFLNRDKMILVGARRGELTIPRGDREAPKTPVAQPVRINLCAAGSNRS